MPLPFTRNSFTHGRLERPQLSNILQILYGSDCFLNIISIGIRFLRLTEDGIEQNGVLLKMLSRSIEVMF